MKGIFTLLIFLLPVLLFGKVKHDEFMVVTPQKTGSHLLAKALTKILKKKLIHYPRFTISRDELIAHLDRAKAENAYLHMHAFPTLEIINTLLDRGVKVIFLMRDPRDQAISFLFYVLDQNWKYGPFRNDDLFGTLPFDDQLDEVITGRRYGLSITQDIIGKRLPWLELPEDILYMSHFEDLVGQEGGGSREQQLEDLYNIADHINLNLSRSKIKNRTRKIYGKPGDATFRSGKLGEWKLYFTPSHVQAFKEVFGQKLIFLNYESDFNW